MSNSTKVTLKINQPIVESLRRLHKPCLVRNDTVFKDVRLLTATLSAIQFIQREH